jgi:hypothetical protein
MPTEITASWETLMCQASGTSQEYFRKAVDHIQDTFDVQFGDLDHKERSFYFPLIVAHMNAASMDFHSAAIGVAAQSIADSIALVTVKD